MKIGSWISIKVVHKIVDLKAAVRYRYPVPLKKFFDKIRIHIKFISVVNSNDFGRASGGGKGLIIPLVS